MPSPLRGRWVFAENSDEVEIHFFKINTSSVGADTIRPLKFKTITHNVTLTVRRELLNSTILTFLINCSLAVNRKVELRTCPPCVKEGGNRRLTGGLSQNHLTIPQSLRDSSLYTREPSINYNLIS